MIPRFRPTLGTKELLAALRPENDEDIQRFESSFAQLMGRKYAVAFPYGRTGLMFLLKAMGLQDKEIICPSYTCVVVPHAIVYSGNTPVFVDSHESDFNMNLDLIPDAITERTAAIIVTSIFGYPVNLDKLDALKRAYPHIKIIQDCAHSFAAEWRGRPVQKEGDAAVFGLNISKLITSVFGGMVITDNDDLYVTIRRLANNRLKNAPLTRSGSRFVYLVATMIAFSGTMYSLIHKLERKGILNRFVKYYDENVIDMPSDHLLTMSGLEARVGKAQITKYRKVVDSREKCARFYNHALRNIREFCLPPIVEGATYSHYVLKVKNRSRLIEQMNRNGIQLGDLINQSIPDMPVYSSYRSVPPDCPISSLFSHQTVNLPPWGSEKIWSCVEGTLHRILL